MNATRPSAPAGALLLLFDIETGSTTEHDDWHTHEHMPERLRMPGFRRGTRWTASDVVARYCVLYEVDTIEALDSPSYRERLDHPTPWTAAMMRRYRNMRRTLCRVDAAAGSGVGSCALVVTFTPEAGRQDALCAWLGDELLPNVVQRAGIVSARLLQDALPASMTREQAIRGPDARVDAALFLTGYDRNVLAALADRELAPSALERRGVANATCAASLFGLACMLSAGDLAGSA